MITHLLDTSVFSQPLKRRPVEAVLQRWVTTGDECCAVSRVVVAEVEVGLQQEQRPSRIAKYEAILRPRLSVLPTDEAIWRAFTRMKARQFQLGRPVADLDLLIAATAAHHNLILATLNSRHFATVEGLRWEDWSV